MRETAAAAARQGAGSAPAQPRADGTDELRTALDALAARPGEPRIVSAAGVTRDGAPLLTLENPWPFAVLRPERRIVLVGGLDGDPAAAARIVLDAVRWFKTEAPERARARWTVSPVPMASGRRRGARRSVGFPPAGGSFDHPDRPASSAGVARLLT